MTASPWVREVDERTFDEQVLAASHTQPVLVDFWAAWCGPCRALAPVLERVANDLGGKVVVAKLDTDANQGLASRFKISGIPACKLFVDGEVVDEFVGALPETTVREFLSRHIKDETDEALSQIARAVQDGKIEDATVAIEALLEAHPTHSGVLLGAAQVALAAGDVDKARGYAAEIADDAKEYEEAQSLLGLADLAVACQKAGGLEPASAALAREPSSDARFGLAACHALAGDYEKALEQMLEIVRVDRAFGDDAARKAMLVVFERCNDEDLVRDYRRQLAIVM